MLRSLFAIPLLHENITIRRSNLYDEIKVRRASKGPELNNYTSYFDSDPMNGVDWSELRGHILTQARRYTEAVFPEGKWSGLKFHKIWWNLYDMNNYHGRHSHGSNYLSGTYYVHMDEHSAPLEFYSPIQSLVWGWNSKYGVGTVWAQGARVYAKTGDLLLWPPWLEHSVSEQKIPSDNLRCTISFNLQIIK